MIYDNDLYSVYSPYYIFPYVYPYDMCVNTLIVCYSIYGMSKTLARIEAEIKANEFTISKMGEPLSEFTHLEQIAYIKCIDSRVITNEEKKLLDN